MWLRADASHSWCGGGTVQWKQRVRATRPTSHYRQTELEDDYTSDDSDHEGGNCVDVAAKEAQHKIVEQAQ